MKNKKSFLFMNFTLIFLILGFVNIHTAYLSFVCMALPFILLFRHKKNIWCSEICPRADYLSLFRFINLGKKAPDWLFSDRTKKYLLQYFFMNLLFIVASTVMVSMSKLPPIDKVRLFIFLQIPWNMPQLLISTTQSPVALHLAYRFYSIMLSSTLMGTVLAVVYKPKT